MGSPFISLLIIIHLVISIFYTVLILIHRSSLTYANILPILCVPIFGPLSAFTAELIHTFKLYDETTESVESLSLNEDIYWKSIKKHDNGRNIVPLEEALIINDHQTRKKLILEMLLDDPMKNIDILLLARENSDVDTAHYANTTIAKIQRDFQLHIQKLTAEHEANPKNVDILNSYIEVLSQFIDSGLSEAYLLKRQRILLSTLLNKKISLVGWSKEILLKKIRNCLFLKDINSAIEANKILIQNLPDDEQTWISALQICVAGHDAKRLQEILREIKQRKIDWSLSGKEQVSTWIEV
ncbi:MAG: hypothetical protein J7L66_03525 [Anaerolineaceae bacterium]|nr:hypothetical protein [Anaerolineaceae bacterium]